MDFEPPVVLAAGVGTSRGGYQNFNNGFMINPESESFEPSVMGQGKNGAFTTFDMPFFMILLEGSKRSFQVVKMVLPPPPPPTLSEFEK